MNLSNESQLWDATLRGSAPGTAAPTLPFQLPRSQAVIGLANLAAALRACAPLPPSALFVGVAEDGLPVLMNLGQPHPSPLLIAADAGAGKTALLRNIARAIELGHDPGYVRYATVTTSPSEWSDLGSSPNCEGILSFHHALTTGYMASLVRWAQSGEGGSRPRHLVILIDDLHALSGDGDLRASRSWLLGAGPSHGIQPIVALSASRPAVPDSWLTPFAVRLFGRLHDHRIQRDLAGSAAQLLDGLQAGSQFAVRESETWLPFWIPEFD